MEDAYTQYIVLWESPRRIVKARNTGEIRGFKRMQVEEDKSIHMVRPRGVFDSLVEIEKYLEIEDYRSIH